MSLENQRIVVIGASSGMGLGVCQLAAEQGAEVIMCSRSQEKLIVAQASVTGSTSILPVDASDLTSLETAFSTIGSFDHLVVSADAGGERPSFVEMTRDQAERRFLKFWIAFHSAQAAVPTLRDGGSITFFSGIAATRPPKQGAAMMAAANGAVIALGRALARELAPVRVNVIAPGSVDTGTWDADTAAGVQAWAESSLPVPRPAIPADIAHGALFLMTNPYITGTVLTIDGGLLLS